MNTKMLNEEKYDIIMCEQWQRLFIIMAALCGFGGVLLFRNWLPGTIVSILGAVLLISVGMTRISVREEYIIYRGVLWIPRKYTYDRIKKATVHNLGAGQSSMDLYDAKGRRLFGVPMTSGAMIYSERLPKTLKKKKVTVKQ